MLDKDKIIIVVYVGVKSSDYYYEIVENVRKATKPLFDESVKMIYVPDHNNFGIKIDCINPVILDEEQFKKADETIDKLVEYCDKFINDDEN